MKNIVMCTQKTKTKTRKYDIPYFMKMSVVVAILVLMMMMKRRTVMTKGVLCEADNIMMTLRTMR